MASSSASVSSFVPQQQRLVVKPMPKIASAQDMMKINIEEELKSLKNQYDSLSKFYLSKYGVPFDAKDDDASSTASHSTHAAGGYGSFTPHDQQQQNFQFMAPHIAAQMAMASLASASCPPSPMSVSPMPPAATYYIQHQQVQDANLAIMQQMQQRLAEQQQQIFEKQQQQQQQNMSSSPSLLREQPQQLGPQQPPKPQQQNYAAVAAAPAVKEAAKASSAAKAASTAKAQRRQHEIENSIKTTRILVNSSIEAQNWLEKIYNFVKEFNAPCHIAELGQPKHGLDKPSKCAAIQLKYMLLSDPQFVVDMQKDLVRLVDYSAPFAYVAAKEDAEEEEAEAEAAEEAADEAANEAAHEEAEDAEEELYTYHGFVYSKPDPRGGQEHVYIRFPAELDEAHQRLFTRQCEWLSEMKATNKKKKDVPAFVVDEDNVKYGLNLIGYKNECDADIFDSLKPGKPVLFYVKEKGGLSFATQIICE